jgi:hypothetical protein
MKVRLFPLSSGTDTFPNLLVLATSAVDLDTDKAIQEIIRGPDFADVTLLTIACVPRDSVASVHVSRLVLKLFLQPPFEYHYRLRPHLGLGIWKGKRVTPQPIDRRALQLHYPDF